MREIRLPIAQGPITLDMRRSMRALVGSAKFVRFIRGLNFNTAVFLAK